MLSFFSRNYLFNPRPDPLSKFLIVLAVIFGLFLIGGIIFLILSKKEKREPLSKLKNSFSNLLFTGGITGILLTFFRWQGIPYLSSRFLLLILILVIFGWLLFLIPQFKKVSQKLKIIEGKEEFEKYLPKIKSKFKKQKSKL